MPDSRLRENQGYVHLGAAQPAVNADVQVSAVALRANVDAGRLFRNPHKRAKALFHDRGEICRSKQP